MHTHASCLPPAPRRLAEPPTHTFKAPAVPVDDAERLLCADDAERVDGGVGGGEVGVLAGAPPKATLGALAAAQELADAMRGGEEKGAQHFPASPLAPGGLISPTWARETPPHRCPQQELHGCQRDRGQPSPVKPRFPPPRRSKPRVISLPRSLSPISIRHEMLAGRIGSIDGRGGETKHSFAPGDSGRWHLQHHTGGRRGGPQAAVTVPLSGSRRCHLLGGNRLGNGLVQKLQAVQDPVAEPGPAGVQTLRGDQRG